MAHRLAEPLTLASRAAACGLQARCPEAQAYVLSGNKDITQFLRMRADQRMPMTIGGMDCRLIKYTVSPSLCTSPAPFLACTNDWWIAVLRAAQVDPN